MLAYKAPVCQRTSEAPQDRVAQKVSRYQESSLNRLENHQRG